jgi:hypothetical protein
MRGRNGVWTWPEADGKIRVRGTKGPPGGG